jgi:histidinol-phosphate aminotransferase
MTSKMKPNNRLLQWARPEIVALKPYQSAREEFVDDGRKMILLDANENPFDNGVNRYPDPMQKKLKQRLAEVKGVHKEQIYLGNGSDEVLNQLMIAFATPGKDEAIIFPPTFGMYKVCADINGVKTIEVPLIKDFQLDVPAILAAQNKRTKMIFIPSPNNPTGNCFAVEDIQQLLEKFNGLVVVDEAYVEFAEDQSILPQLSDYDNLVVVQTFSKAQGLAGVRLGMCFGDSIIIDLMNKVKAPYNINVLTQELVIKRLDEQGHVHKQVHQIRLEKERLVQEIISISFVKNIYPSNTNFFLAKVDNSNKRYKQLIERGIVVRNPSKNLNCANTLRITVGTPQENNALISALRTMDSE